jgi:hypothetical protein
MVITFLEIVMKIRFFLLTALLLVGFNTGTYAAKKDPDSSLNFNEKNVMSDDGQSKDDDDKQPNHGDHDGNNKTMALNIGGKLADLTERHDDERNVFVRMSRNEDGNEHHGNGDDEHHGNGDGSENDHINAVPLPAALWLFGSGLLGLLGSKRKSA